MHHASRSDAAARRPAFNQKMVEEFAEGRHEGQRKAAEAGHAAR